MKNIIIVEGISKSGKTSFIKKMINKEIYNPKIQIMYKHFDDINTPGEYITYLEDFIQYVNNWPRNEKFKLYLDRSPISNYSFYTKFEKDLIDYAIKEVNRRLDKNRINFIILNRKFKEEDIRNIANFTEQVNFYTSTLPEILNSIEINFTKKLYTF